MAPRAAVLRSCMTSISTPKVVSERWDDERVEDEERTAEWKKRALITEPDPMRNWLVEREGERRWEKEDERNEVGE